VTALGEHGRHLAEGALEALRWHWDRAYDFGWDGAKCVARRADTGELVTAPTPETLNGAVRPDHCARPVSQDLTPARCRRRAG
jgi:hypothetical protein